MRITKNLLVMTTLFGALVVGAMPARSEVIIGNFDFDLEAPPSNLLSIDIGQDLTATTSFKMNETSYLLNDAVLFLNLQAPVANPQWLANAPLLELWSDSGTQPLVTFQTPDSESLTIGSSLVTFGLENPYELKANTSYFLRLTSSNTAGAFFQWLRSNPGVVPTGVGAEYLSGYLGSYQLNGTPGLAAVPEPASIVMIGATLPLAVGYLWRRRRGRTAA